MNHARKLESERDEAREDLEFRRGLYAHLCEAYKVKEEYLETAKRERGEARERERVAIASWDEERQRALREGECVLEARRERDEARKDAANLRRMSVVELMCENLNVKHHVEGWENRCLKAERERDEAIQQRHETNESSKYAMDYAIRERDEAREALASREVVLAQQRVITDLILERDQARAVLQEIEAARWHTACELRRIATGALGNLTIPTK